MRKILAVIVSFSFLFTFLPSIAFAEPQIKAVGSSGAVRLLWQEAPGASFYRITRLSPVFDELFPKPIAATSWVDANPTPDKPNVYQVTALSANLDLVYAYPQATATPDKAIPTLEKPCHVVLSFTIGDKRYTENGQAKTMSASPLVKDGRSYLVIRHVIEPLFGDVGWDAGTKKITLTALGKTIVMQVGNPKATVDGKERPIDTNNPKVSPFIVSGRTYVPLRFPVEALGSGSIDWFAATKTAVLSFPLGCQEVFEGQITKITSSGFEAKGTSGARSFDKPVPVFAKPGSCIYAMGQTISGKRMTGLLAVVPCKDDCSGERFEGEVVSANAGLMVTTPLGATKTFKMGKNLPVPIVGQCVSLCSKDSIVLTLQVVSCPPKVYEGKVLYVDCQTRTFGLSVAGTSINVRLTKDFDCGTLKVGECARVEGQPDKTDPSFVNAVTITIIKCKVGAEFVLFAQTGCINFKAKTMDIEAKEFEVSFPSDFNCGDLRGGDCLKVVGVQEGQRISALQAATITAPKGEGYSFKATVATASPLVVVIPGGPSITVALPPYIKAPPKVGAPIEIWGKVKDGAVKAVKISEVQPFTKTVTGRVVGAVCQERAIFLRTDKAKIRVVLPDQVDCEGIEFDTCLLVTGVFEDDETILATSVEKIECQTGCSGQIKTGMIVSVDCQAKTVRIKVAQGEYFNVLLPENFACADLRKGLCLEVCGQVKGDVLEAQTVVVKQCPPVPCTGSQVEGYIASVDCAKGVFTMATETGILEFFVPETFDCSVLARGMCANVCTVGEGKTLDLEILPCSKIGTVIEGTVIRDENSDYLAQTKTGREIRLATNSKLKAGECFVALGEFSAQAPDRFIAKITVVVACDVSTIQATVSFVDCKEKQIVLDTNTGHQTFALPQNFDCKGLLPGDCVMLRQKEGATLIDKVPCPATNRAHLAMLVTDTKNGTAFGTDLSGLDRFEVRGGKSPRVGDVVIVEGHRVSSRLIQDAVFTPIDIGCVKPATFNLRLTSYNEMLKAGTFVDSFGGQYVVLMPKVDGPLNIPKDEYQNLRVLDYNTGFGPRCYVATENYPITESLFKRTTVTGVIFAIDTVDEMVLLHLGDGNNMAVRPADPSILKIIKVGDCANATGNFDSSTKTVTGASLEVSDCFGGKLGVTFTGVVVGVNSIDRNIDVVSDKIGTYEVTVESVAQLANLTLGDCVAVSGIITDQEALKVLGKTVARIDCKKGGNEPVAIEGEVAAIDLAAKQVVIDTIDGAKWTAYIERPESCPGIKVGAHVRCSGLLQAKQGVIARAYLKKITMPSSKWSVIGEVTQIQDGSFELRDGPGRIWKVLGAVKKPAVGDRLLCVGTLPPDSLAELEKAVWTNIGNWAEPKSGLLGTVFGMSCGMDKLVIRDSGKRMVSLRLPHTGFCGTFSFGECISVLGRMQATLPGLAKVTDVKASTQPCMNETVVGVAIARSNTDKFALLYTLEGKVIRCSFDTEATTSKMLVGRMFKVSGRYVPSSPDTLKVSSFEEVSGPTYQTIGTIVHIDNGYIFVQEAIGRVLKVKPFVGFDAWAGLLNQTVSVSGKFKDDTLVAEFINPVDVEPLAAELEGTVLASTETELSLMSETGSVWKIEGSFATFPKGANLFVVGKLDMDRWWTIVDAKAVQVDGKTPTSQMLFWGSVQSTDCKNNSVFVKIDDGTVYEVHPEDLGICESFTPGERIQISGSLAVGHGKLLGGARLVRSGLAGARKSITGTISEISCTSRTLMVKEDARDGATGEVWLIKLKADAKCEDLSVGQRVRVNGDPVPTKPFQLEDCDVLKIEAEIVSAKVTGQLESWDCEEGIMVVVSEGKLYKIVPAVPEDCKKLFVGDTLEVTGKSSVYRKSILFEATWSKINDDLAYRLLSGKIDFQACPQVRLYDTGGEYWRVNIREDQPCSRLSAGMLVTLKGLPDQASQHLMNKAIILNTMQKRTIIGSIDEILCDQGEATIMDAAGALWNVELEMPFDECLDGKFSKGDKVVASGLQNYLYPDSTLYFAKLEPFGNETGLIPMDFVGEVLSSLNDCKSNNIDVKVGHIPWRVRPPVGFDCSQIQQGSFIRITGGRESFSQKICQASRIEKTQPVVFGFVNEANYSKMVYDFAELRNPHVRWQVTLADNSKLYKKGQFGIVTGNLAGGTRAITGASLTEMVQIKGRIQSIDHTNQQVIVNGEDYNKYTVSIKTEWINLEEFKVDQTVAVIGVKKAAKGKEIEISNAYMEDFNPRLLGRNPQERPQHLERTTGGLMLLKSPQFGLLGATPV